MIDPAYIAVAVGAMSLSIAAATYYAHALRHAFPVSKWFNGPSSPMSLGGSLMMLTVIGTAGLGRGPVTLLIVIVCGLVANVALHALAGPAIEKISLLAPVLTFATAWHSGLF